MLVVTVVASAHAQSTEYVPIGDPIYDDLDYLSSRGVIVSRLQGERPHSRVAIRRFAVEAGSRAASSTPGGSRYREAMERLQSRFGPSAHARRTLGLQSLGVAITAADSPYRELRAGRAGERIDGLLNPLLERNGGRVLADGWSGSVEGTVVLSSGWLAGAATQRVSLYSSAVRALGTTDVSLGEGYLRSTMGSMAIEVGRRVVVLGQGRLGGPILSGNARGLDMVRVGNDYPVRLPGVLGGLGLWQASVAVADMGRARAIPGSKLAVVRVGAKPSDHLEVGFSYFNHQGGEGAPTASLGERVRDFLFIDLGEEQQHISDKVVAADMRLSLPAARLAVYVNALSTYQRGGLSEPAGGLWEDAIWLAGARLGGVGPQARLDAWAEWRHAGAEAHTHWQFTSGLTLDGRVMGDPLGPNASGLEGGLQWSGPNWSARVIAAWERYSGDRFQLHEPESGRDRQWVRVEDNPDETRGRLTVGWTRLAQRPGWQMSARVAYEVVTRFDYSDHDRSNFVTQVVVSHVR